MTRLSLLTVSPLAAFPNPTDDGQRAHRYNETDEEVRVTDAVRESRDQEYSSDDSPLRWPRSD
jgi:hypothetical protein